VRNEELFSKECYGCSTGEVWAVRASLTGCTDRAETAVWTREVNTWA
jgi:hypothetical protein